MNRCLRRAQHRLPHLVRLNPRLRRKVRSRKKIRQTYLRHQRHHLSRLLPFRSGRSRNIQQRQNRHRLRRQRLSRKHLSAKSLIPCARQMKRPPRLGQLHSFVFGHHQHRSRKVARHRHHQRRDGWVRPGAKKIRGRRVGEWTNKLVGRGSRSTSKGEQGDCPYRNLQRLALVDCRLVRRSLWSMTSICRLCRRSPSRGPAYAIVALKLEADTEYNPTNRVCSHTLRHASDFAGSIKNRTRRGESYVGQVGERIGLTHQSAFNIIGLGKPVATFGEPRPTPRSITFPVSLRPGSDSLSLSTPSSLGLLGS